MLVVFGGLPGVGKTTAARELARRLGAVYLRVDTIEQGLIAAGVPPEAVGAGGYGVGYALAGENLRLGRTVVADSVNPLTVTRDAWREVGRRAGAPVIEVEMVCSDAAEHRRRVETRAADIPGHRLPTWPDVLAREYQPWERDRLVIDTAARSPAEALGNILAALPSLDV